MAITLNGTTGITTPAIDNQGNLTVDGGTIKLDGNYPVGTGNVALGNTALDSNVSGEYNTAIGDVSLTSNTTGLSNVSVGAYSMENNVGGNYNTSVGVLGLRANTSGANNTGLGYAALLNNTAAINNTAVGYEAGYSNTTGGYSVFVGHQAGYNSSPSTTNVGNTLVGPYAGYSLNTGIGNTFIGGNNLAASGYSMTTGSKNTIIGGYNGNQGGLDIRTSDNNIVLSDGDGNPRVYVSSSGCVSIGTVSTTTDAISRFGGSSSVFSQKMVNAYGGGTAIHAENTNNQGWIYARFNTNGSQVGYISVGTSSTSYVTSSDYRLKENVVYDWDATTRLKQLKPARFNFIVDADTTVDGFLAHEAQAVVPEAVHGTHNEVDADGVAVMQGIDQSKLVPLLVKTIQELEARITALEGN
jgi:hypothetical protein